jgi:hypothetical protein
MTLDSRAYAWCSLGPLAPGGGSSIAEGHVQGTGVITYRGTINLAGIHRPAPGAVVELAYSDGQNWIARLPLRLRVLSSFANPLGGKTTAVSVGCDLAYFEDRKRPPTSLATRQANPDTPEAVWRAAAPAISAAWLVGQILTALGITAAGACPLTNHYTRQEFDMTAGYVEELGKLAHSEGYAVRMNPAGLLEFINKAPQGLAASVLLTEADLIDLNPINTGDLPGDAVYAKYTNLKLKAPDDPSEDEQRRRNWERDFTEGGATQFIHNWTHYATVPAGTRQKKNNLGYPVYNSAGQPVLENAYETRATPIREYITVREYSETTSLYDSRDRLTERTTSRTGVWGTTRTTTAYTYPITFPARGVRLEDEIIPHEWQQVKEEVTVTTSPLAPIYTQVGIQGSYADMSTGEYVSGKTIKIYDRDISSGITKTFTRNFVPYISTPFGAESIARMRDGNDERLPFADIDLLAFATQLVEYGSEVSINTSREFGTQRRPSEAERTSSANQKAPTVEEEARIAWAVGTAASQTQVKLSPPYAPDDRINAAGQAYIAIKSDAAQRVLHFARTENRLLLGHRNGVGIQVLPEVLPPVPLGLINIRLNGCTAAFRVNGTTWNIDPQGVTATTDALFWGAIDGTVADAWFPLPPGASSLPAPVAVSTNVNPRPANAISIPAGFSFTNPNLQALFASLPTDAPPVFGSSVTPAVLVKPYHEAVEWTAGGGGGAFVSTLPWAPQTVSLAVGGGGGVALGRSLRLMAGGGSGAHATPTASVPAMAGGGGGAFALDGAPLLTFASGTPMNWDDTQVLYGFSFTLATAKLVDAIGVYDPGSNGLGSSYSLAITTSSDLSIFPDNAILINGQSETAIPSGTAAALVDGYRKVSITGGPTLDPGTYWLVLLANGVSGVDPILKNLTSASAAPGVTFGANAQWEFGGAPEHATISADGVAYVGPMIWFV